MRGKIKKCRKKNRREGGRENEKNKGKERNRGVGGELTRSKLDRGRWADSIKRMKKD